METNGLLIDDDMARFLKEKRLGSISISLDGADAATHDSLRGVAGAFERAKAGIRALAAAGFKPQAICTLHRANADQMEAVIALAVSLGCGSVKFNHIQSVGRGVRMKTEAGLDGDEVLRLYRTMERDIAPSSAIPLFFDIPMAFRSPRALLRGSLGLCGILGILGVLSAGELSLCGIGVTVPELIYGELGERELRDVWCNADGLVQLRRTVPRHLGGICGRCIHRDLCMGECAAQVYLDERILGSAFPFCADAERRGVFPRSRLRVANSEEQYDG
jgi:SynChlorMet cassette radical SAM/SPASM protein ScmF